MLVRRLTLLLAACGPPARDPDADRRPEPSDSGSLPAPTTPPTTEDLPPYEAPFLWAPLSFEGAIDLGHVPADVTDPVPPGPLLFTDVGAAAGLVGSRSGGADHGVGLAFVDVDGDGWDDLVAVNGISPIYTFHSALWRNLGDGSFEDVSVTSGIEAILGGRDATSIAAGDVDQDGDVDLYVGGHPNDVLLLNDGDGAFTDGTVAAGAGGPASLPVDLNQAKIVGLGDYDADGRLDVVSASDAFLDPGPNGYVLRGLGGASFADVTAATGFAAPPDGTPCAVMWTDHDADGRADLAIWSDLGSDPSTNRVLLASDGVTFADVSGAVGWVSPTSNPMGIDAADIDRDGWLDYLVGNAGQTALLLSGGDPTWVDYGQAAGITANNSWGLGIEDLDADRRWDLFLGQPGSASHLAFRNLDTSPPTFERVEVPHADLARGNVPVALADYDHDGDVDVASGNTGGSPIGLYRNDTDRGTARTLEVRVDAAPGDGARGAVGARVVVAVGGEVLWRDVSGGSSRASQHALSARFGLGQRTGAEWVAVLWPDGRQVAAVGVPGDATLVFDAGTAELR